MYATNGSYAIGLWIAELSLRAKEEREAMDAAKSAQPSTMGRR